VSCIQSCSPRWTCATIVSVIPPVSCWRKAHTVVVTSGRVDGGSCHVRDHRAPSSVWRCVLDRVCLIRL
jgi:hypothetical protein